MDSRARDRMAGAVATRASRRGVLGWLAGGFLLASGPGVARAQCELVELYPGYPGYRGYVTGLDGVGDHECVEDLEAADPGFDRAAEDSANLAAAARLGLDGAMEEWTWENWMAVEAERGLPSTCYACAIFDAAGRAEPASAPVEPDDPRLLIGGYGTDYALSAFVPGGPSSPQWSALRQLLPYDHYARAILGMANPGHWNATQMLDGYETLVNEMFRPGAGVPSFGPLYLNLLDQGGYAPTPATAPTDDQAFMVGVGIEAALVFLPGAVQEPQRRAFSSLLTAWRAERAAGSTVSLAEWLRANGPEV